MNPQSTPTSRICPTCGSKISENATRCQVCGRNLLPGDAKSANKPIQGSRLPEIHLSLPLAIGVIILLLALGAGVIYSILSGTGRVIQPTASPTVTLTPTMTVTPLPSETPTPLPSFTPLPPVEYAVKSGDTCLSIAYGYGLTTSSGIITLNNLAADCSNLSIGQRLLIPQPTPTASPMPTSTMSEADTTEQACEKVSYSVGENDTLSGIANAYRVSIDSIKVYNGLTSDTVYQGQALSIPLCERLPTAGPTPTPTAPPPYSSPNLLLPADGTSFTIQNETITLQWASIGELRQNETYMVTVVDVTDGSNRKLVDYSTDTKYIVPVTFRPAGNIPHVIRWSITVARQTGTTRDGNPIWEAAGASSYERVFTWWGGAPAATPAPVQ
ncbi:MAG: LysM peptidoglycan-binding domain-containing protein [Leptolinea sp.]|jgi:LysM repeat protein|nr:LysM peptidoglycan-binding domain-containing protein [Leptolinea sp.]